MFQFILLLWHSCTTKNSTEMYSFKFVWELELHHSSKSDCWKFIARKGLQLPYTLLSSLLSTATKLSNLFMSIGQCGKKDNWISCCNTGFMIYWVLSGSPGWLTILTVRRRLRLMILKTWSIEIHNNTSWIGVSTCYEPNTG